MFEAQKIAKKVLIIDDDPGIIKMLEGGLNTIGYRVVSAVDPQDGLEKARQLKPDLIILDVIFPEMSGYDVIEILKKNSETKGIPIIMLTIKGSEEDIQKGLDLGAEDYVTKPVYMELFLKRVQNLSGYPLLETERAFEGRPKIFVIDDEAEMARLLKIELELEGYDVTLAFDGKSGLEGIKQLRPDLVLLDVMMPDMSGYEVLRVLKGDPLTNQIAVVLLTAKGLEKDILKGISLGAADYIPKPFHPGLLIKRIKTILVKP